ncbi:ATP-binding protein [Actinomadura sp. 3N407]|uniref:ATP-binding protein n=1 Tax=Actinomadura sp. 3N407 TaxID=3457423 RepID=UPI003FCDDB24
MLYGRPGELDVVGDLVAGAREKRGGALVVRGEAGIGKTALLEHAASTADGLRVISATGVEAETELTFAGLHLLLAPFLDRVDALPAPQATALQIAFGRISGIPVDRFLIGLATLSFFDEIANEAPLLVIVDDAQWLDHASSTALLFAARRIHASPVVVIFAVRDGCAFPASGVPDLRLGSLDRTASAQLLGEHWDLAAHVRDRILDEARGNPLALRELPRTLTPAQRSGDLPPVPLHIGTEPVTGRVEEAFAARVDALPEGTRIMLTIAGADDTGDLHTVLTAAAAMGASPQDLGAAEREQLVRVTDQRIFFGHPLMRSAAYRRAPASWRIDAHRALAEAATPDRRAWHLSAAATGHDEEAATALEGVAEQARSYGDSSVVAAAYERAAQLTADPKRRLSRWAAAADSAHDAGQPERAARLAAKVSDEPADPLAKARLARVAAAIAYERNLPGTDHLQVVEAALGVRDIAPDMTASMITDSILAVRADRDIETARRLARRVSGIRSRSPFLEWVGTAMEQVVGAELDADVPSLRRHLTAIDTSGFSLCQGISVLWFHYWLGDLNAALDSAAGLASDCRERGAAGTLARVLVLHTRILVMSGRIGEAATTAAEGRSVATATDQPHYVALFSGLQAYVAAIAGDGERCRALSDDLLNEAPGEHASEAVYARNLLDASAGRYEDVIGRTEILAADPVQGLNIERLLGLPVYAEAAARCGRPELVTEACAQFGRYARATGQAWIMALDARCRALLADPAAAGDHYAQALRLHRDDDKPFERARTELLYGQWLRRRLQRNQARPLLRSALETFERLGAPQWAEQTRTELRATGETPAAASRSNGLLDRLTPQELQVAQLAAEGLTNREIAARLFLSPRTVGYHLYKAYPKLQIASRNDLVRLDLT